MDTKVIMSNFAENIYTIAEYVDNLPHKMCGVEFGSKQNPRKGMIVIENGELNFYEGILLLLDSKVSLAKTWADRRDRLALVCSYNEVYDLYCQVLESKSSAKGKMESHCVITDIKTGTEIAHYTKDVEMAIDENWTVNMMMLPGRRMEVYLKERLDYIHKRWEELVGIVDKDTEL